VPDIADFDFERESRALCSHAEAALARPRPFALTGDEAHYARDLVVDVKHIKLEIRIDPKRRLIEGTATHKVQAINAGVRSVDFDAAEMEIRRVTVGGKPARFDYSDPVLRVEFDRQMSAGGETQIAITYSAHPRRGLYFVASDEDYPDKPLQAWTQGQDEDSRHWLLMRSFF